MLQHADRPWPPCASLRARRSGDTVGDFCKRAAMFPFVIITPSVLFFSLPRTFPSFHRDTDEILMRPGTVGAPPGDPAVEYFNCTFYAKCLPSKDATALELDELRAVKRRRGASRSHNAQSPLFIILLALRVFLRHQNIVQQPSDGCWGVNAAQAPFKAAACCLGCNIHQASAVCGAFPPADRWAGGIVFECKKRDIQRRCSHSIFQ